ncbi:MAG: DUF839 domain-containing protein [Acidimicrobiia bacterium]|nr:DUF839 domain-containing protein [Acidimicrobiia bacterium]
MTHTRRDLLQRGALAGAGLVFAGELSGLFSRAPAVAATPGSPSGGRPLGPLLDDPNGLLDLPEGFGYRVLSQVGDIMDGGRPVPDSFDGMAAFGRYRWTVLVRNHEQDTEATVPAIATPDFTYDRVALGGTTTLHMDRSGSIENQYTSLAGTNDNCAGGLTPWDTWLTCEETEDRAGDDGQEKDHGFVFEVDPFRPRNNIHPTPLTGLGRFAHEAATIDPYRQVVYLTEDAREPNGLVYRMLPHRPLRTYGSLRAGGVLQAMRCTDGGTFVPDLSAYSVPGSRLQVGWVDVPDPLAAGVPTRVQLPEVTRSRKLEGLWWGRRSAYIVASYARNTDGSVGEHDGQVWRLRPDRDTLTLEVSFGVNPDTASDRPDGPDNITVSPWGGVLLAEDGSGTQLLQAVSAEGVVVPLARNARDESEFAGVCFSPDRRTLFANLQQPGVTFAITGPFNRVRNAS